MGTHDRRRVVEVAEGILDGRIGVIDGARRLCRLRSSVCEDDLDADFLRFIGIDSETDTLPIGEVRDVWSADTLVRKGEELKAAEALYRDVSFGAYRKLLARFGEPSNQRLQTDAATRRR